MSLFSTLQFILKHPLNHGRPISAIGRFIAWQIRSRIQKDIIFNWIDGSKLLVRRGMTGATGNIYCGLHEYEDMSFLLHLLRPGDLFIDVGANIGSYTVLASRVCGAKSIAVEPDPETAVTLRANLQINGITADTSVAECALGAERGVVDFTVGLDTINQVTGADDGRPTRKVQLKSLDEIIGDSSPTFIKMDVEGFETEVLKGAAKTLEKRELLAIEIETLDPEALAILSTNSFSRFSYDPKKRVLVEALRPSNSNYLFIRDHVVVSTRTKTAPIRRYREQKL